ncbi:wall-associated receptor kinase 2-like [Cornus florida]|uniref:wall-associated receptor kinase 2-like n=1 Tax=Cornus florida TaxID=4283 RepID=UPI00289E518D|nr:wall-associated receptor kinase 2-like [Cornus florida]
MKPIVLQLWYVILIAWAAASASAGTEEVAATSMALPGCKDKCGNVSVPYPFGIDDSKCSKNESYLLNCTVEASLDSSPRLMMGNIQLMNIFVENGTSIVNIFMAYNCYNKSTNKMDFYDHEVNLTGAPFMFSATEIKFTEIGCNTLAFIADSEGTRFGSGCLSLCSQDLQEGSCNGVGCCRTEIPTRLKTLEMSIAPVNDTYDQSFRPCSYAFLAHQNWSGYWSINLSDTAHVTREAPVVLDWVVGDETCQSLDQSPSKSACGPNSDCHDSVNGPGYRCICKSGYHGNPYLPEGCQDINECENQNEYHCEGKCDNIPGNYTCHCPLGMYGNGKVACKGFRITTIVGVCAAGVTLVVLFIFLWMELRRRNKMKYFRKNGGLLLKHQRVRIFREAELERATNNYDAPRLLGQGGSATVYKGVLEDNSVVAIKKPKETERTQNKHLPLEVITEQFQHEINILFQVNHINVVKLLGLCLETKIPLLVYEFVSNGSLYDHIHVKRSTTLRSWVNCLKIAAESALALDYLHSLADPPVIHGDV